jgi:hypothetical protein
MSAAPSKRRKLPSQEYLLTRFTYRDGALFWKSRPETDFETARLCKIWNSNCASKRAGSPMGNGYRTISLCGAKILEHRIVYSMFHGDIPPENVIDHIDGDHTNNRIENLQSCLHSQNIMKQHRRVERDLPKGVWWSVREQKFKAGITLSRKRHHIGTFETLEQAIAAIRDAREKFHGAFASHGDF